MRRRRIAITLRLQQIEARTCVTSRLVLLRPVLSAGSEKQEGRMVVTKSLLTLINHSVIICDDDQ